MTNWDAMQDSLAKAFSEATKIPFIWEDEPRNCLQKPYGVLSFGQSKTVGKDYSRYDFNNSDVILNTYGHREITVTVQAFSRKAKGEHSSRSILEKARLSIASQGYMLKVKNTGLIFVESHPIVDLNFSFDLRHESRSSFDAVFRMLLHDEQKANHTGYFDHIELKEAFDTIYKNLGPKFL